MTLATCIESYVYAIYFQVVCLRDEDNPKDRYIITDLEPEIHFGDVFEYNPDDYNRFLMLTSGNQEYRIRCYQLPKEFVKAALNNN